MRTNHKRNPEAVHHAADATRPQALSLLARVDRLKVACTCEHGHMECAAFENGPCSDELLNLYPSLAR